jgi:hypothetical protein
MDRGSFDSDSIVVKIMIRPHVAIRWEDLVVSIWLESVTDYCGGISKNECSVAAWRTLRSESQAVSMTALFFVANTYTEA